MQRQIYLISHKTSLNLAAEYGAVIVVVMSEHAIELTSRTKKRSIFSYDGVYFMLECI